MPVVAACFGSRPGDHTRSPGPLLFAESACLIVLKVSMTYKITEGIPESALNEWLENALKKYGLYEAEL